MPLKVACLPHSEGRDPAHRGDSRARCAPPPEGCILKWLRVPGVLNSSFRFCSVVVGCRSSVVAAWGTTDCRETEDVAWAVIRPSSLGGAFHNQLGQQALRVEYTLGANLPGADIGQLFGLMRTSHRFLDRRDLISEIEAGGAAHLLLQRLIDLIPQPSLLGVQHPSRLGIHLHIGHRQRGTFPLRRADKVNRPVHVATRVYRNEDLPSRISGGRFLNPQLVLAEHPRSGNAASVWNSVSCSRWLST